MANTWSKSRICQAGIPGPTLKKSSAFGLSGVVVLSCAGPVTSVAAGSTIDLSTYFSKCYGGHISRTAGENANYAYYFKPTATTFAAATAKIVALRTSTGAQVTAATDLHNEKITLIAWGC